MREEMVTIPKRWISELLPYLESGMDEAANAIGQAGHTPSEVMELDLHYLEQLKITLSRK